MFIIQGLLNTPSLVLYSSKNRLKTCERFVLLDPQILMRGVQLTALLPFYRMRRLHYWDSVGIRESLRLGGSNWGSEDLIGDQWWSFGLNGAHGGSLKLSGDQ